MIEKWQITYAYNLGRSWAINDDSYWELLKLHKHYSNEELTAMKQGFDDSFSDDEL